MTLYIDGVINERHWQRHLQRQLYRQSHIFSGTKHFFLKWYLALRQWKLHLCFLFALSMPIPEFTSRWNPKKQYLYAAIANIFIYCATIYWYQSNPISFLIWDNTSFVIALCRNNEHSLARTISIRIWVATTQDEDSSYTPPEPAWTDSPRWLTSRPMVYPCECL